MSVLYDQSGYTYDQYLTWDGSPASFSPVSFTAAACISKTATQTFTARTNIQPTGVLLVRADIINRTNQNVTIRAYASNITSTKTLLTRADIRNSNTRRICIAAQIITTRRMLSIQAVVARGQLLMKAWISRQQGWPIIDPSSPYFPLFTPTQLNIKASILNNNRVSNQYLILAARIKTSPLGTITIRSSIVRCGFISMQASIVPIVGTTTVLGEFNILGNSDTIIQGTFYVMTIPASQYSLTMQAAISCNVTKRVVGHFTIPAMPASGPVDSISSSASYSSRGILQVRAQIGFSVVAIPSP